MEVTEEVPLEEEEKERGSRQLLFVPCRRGFSVFARLRSVQCAIRSMHGSPHVSCHHGKFEGMCLWSESDSHEGVLLERPQAVFDGFAG